MKLRRVSKKHPCKVCKADHWCGYSENGSIAVCMRIESEKRTKNRGFLHVLKEGETRAPRTEKPIVHSHELAARAHLDAIYSTLIRKHLVLAKNHRENLRARGLTDAEIERNGYTSIPTQLYFDNTARALAEYDLRGVPGFYKVKTWHAVHLPAGFFIPIRDSKNRVRALQARVDEGSPRYLWFSSANKPEGVSSGAPVHFSRPHLIEEQNRLFVTEGALKADVIAAKLNAPVIGLAGVTTWPRGFGQKLRRVFPKVREIELCFDSDFKTNPHVKRALFALINELRLAAYAPSVLVWDDSFKGFDDFLIGKAA